MIQRKLLLSVLSVFCFAAQASWADEYQQGWAGDPNAPQVGPLPSTQTAAPSMLQGGIQQSFMTGGAQQAG